MHNVGRMGKHRHQKQEKDSAAQPGETSPEALDSAHNTTMKSLEVVTWRDANFTFSDEEFDGDYLCATVGWTEAEGQWLKIVSEVTPSGERAVTRVPLVNVVERTRVSPSTSITLPEPMESTSSISPKSDGMNHTVRDWC